MIIVDAMAESVEHPMVANWPAGIGRSPSLDGERFLWGMVVFIMLLDVVTTTGGLQYGLQEGNALVGVAIETFGIAGLLLVKVVVLGLAATVVVWIPDRVIPIVPLGLVLPTLIAVTTNIALVGML